MATVLLVEDDETIRRLVRFALNQCGLEVEVAGDGKAALEAYKRQRPDVVVLDLLLPEVDGFEVCRRIRELGPTPILMLTALVQDTNVIRGFEVGADDYLTKPFSVRVLQARVEALLRRAGVHQPETASIVTAGDLSVDLRRVEVRLRGAPVELTRNEFRILSCLARNQGRVVSSLELLQQIHENATDEREAQDLVKVHIRNLRAKLELDGEAPRYIRTVRGFGYMLDQ